MIVSSIRSHFDMLNAIKGRIINPSLIYRSIFYLRSKKIEGLVTMLKNRPAAGGVGGENL